MNHRLKHIITLGALTLSAILALGACSIRAGSSNENTTSNIVAPSSEAAPSSSAQSTTESSSNTPSSSEAPISSEQQPSSSEAPSSSEEPVVLVNITATNNKENYEYGDSLDVTVVANYSDGSQVTLNQYDVAGFDSTISGTQTLTITYEDKTTTLDVYVKPRVNLFPADEFAAFLFDNSVLLTVPSPVGYEAWTNNIAIDNQKMPVFEATTIDDGVAASYTELLVEDGTWIMDTTNNAAVKENVKVEYYSNSGTFYFKAHILDLDPNSSTEFPAEQLQEFLTANSLTDVVPSATSNHRWHYETGEDANLGNYFYTVTNDEGVSSVDSIEDSYLATLATTGWTIDSAQYSQEGYYATKYDVKMNFYTADGHFALYVYEYDNPERPIGDQFGEWQLITNPDALNDGDHVIIADRQYGVVMSNFKSNYVESISGIEVIDDGIRNLPSTAAQFVIHKNGSSWTFNYKGSSKLGSSGERKLMLGSGLTDWSISITSGNAFIVNTETNNGKIGFSTSLNVFTTFKTFDDSRVLPQIYRFVEMVPTYPTAVNLSAEETSIGIGKTAQVSVAYTPVDTNIKIITWSSSKPDVATVDNKGLVKGISEGLATITLTAMDANLEPITGSITFNVVADLGDAWTIMMYICGSNLESENGLASMDIDEILSVNGQPDDINIIMETGGSKSWTNTQISSSKLGRFHVDNKTLIKDAEISNASMGKTSTFTSFMNWGLENYPAEKVGVIFWNHGGALDGVCSDEKYDNDSLLNSEVKSALISVFQTQGLDHKLEFIGYDACLMAVQDVASFNSQFFNYMVCSEETETGYGWTYDGWVDDLYAYKPTETVLKAICDSFISSCDSMYGSHSKNDQTLAVLKLSNMAAYCEAFETMASAIKSKAKSDIASFRNILKNCKGYADEKMGYSDYQTYVNYYGYPSEWFTTYTQYGQTYYILHGYYMYGTLDAYDALTKLKANNNYSAYGSQIDAAKTALTNLIIYNKIGGAAGESHGLALYAVMSDYYGDYPSSETDLTNWRSIFA